MLGNAKEAAGVSAFSQSRLVPGYEFDSHLVHIGLCKIVENLVTGDLEWRENAFFGILC